tara:strand:- start:540 stop:752 length:213 start_codon:yes stop_codon:yes gene_type:complete
MKTLVVLNYRDSQVTFHDIDEVLTENVKKHWSSLDEGTIIETWMDIKEYPVSDCHWMLCDSKDIFYPKFK